MGIFSMGGAQITGPLAFREHFDALDFLSQLELAAGFAVLQLGCLSAWDKYNSEVLYQSVFLGRECLDSPLSRPQDYLELDMFLDAREERAVRSMLGDARVLGTLRAVWDLAESAGDALAAPGADPQWARSRFFLALSAGCLLARRSPGEPVPEPACAAAAYLKRPLARDAGRWLQLPDGGRLTLEPRAEPYRVLLDARGIQRLPRGERLSLCRLAAAPGGGAVELELYRGAYDEHPHREAVAPGDYRYITLAGGRPVFLHPLEVQNGYCRMSRRDNRLFWRMHSLPEQSAELPGDVVSFAPEPDGGGWAAVLPGGRLDLSHCSLGALPYAARRLRSAGAVQVSMRGAVCLVLQSSGAVVSNLADIHAEGLTNLDSAEFRELGGRR